MYPKKYFLITIDTEGDNLWEWKEGDNITVENGKWLDPFQLLCEQYKFVPTYFINYEVASDDYYVGILNSYIERNTCEIGIHLHAWNTPPDFRLDKIYNGQPYLIEYPISVMKEKFDFVYNLISTKFKIRPTSHRAGRWAMNNDYFDILKEYGIIADCSFTPGVSWKHDFGATRSSGADYSSASYYPCHINGVLEIPMTIRKIRGASTGSILHRIRTRIAGEHVWLRPSTFSSESIINLIEKVDSPTNDYLEFMIHSSELMPGGSIYCQKQDDVSRLYDRIKTIFDYVSLKGYEGISVSDYAKMKIM